MGAKEQITRIYSKLDNYLKPGKVLIIYGPRQAGKTTLLEGYLSTTHFRYRLESGDNVQIQRLLSDADFDTIKNFVAGYELIAIDEAQEIPNIGQALKIMVDQVPGLRVVATGSSSFELAGQVGEPLTGRKVTLTLYPVSQLELSQLYNPQELFAQLERWLIFGSYPEVVAAENDLERQRLVQEVAQSYLLKDILTLDRVRSSRVLVDLLRLLAFQVGSEVSLSELAQKLGIDSKTVGRYIDLLEKGFVIYTLRGFSRNLRKELTKKPKYYFYDTGVRNAIISNFNPLNLRNDIGALWENFLIMERIKKQNYQELPANNYFWRTWEQKEIDFVEEREGKLFGYEFKWGKNKRALKAPQDWIKNYPEASFTVIDRDNYLEFVVGD